MAVAISAVSLTGCVAGFFAPVVPPAALIYTDYSAPIDTFAADKRLGERVGTAEVVNILGIVSTGDASVAAAAEAAGIDVIRHIDYRMFSVLFVFSRFTTIVYGDAAPVTAPASSEPQVNTGPEAQP
jgi:hypothetical protein